MDLKTALLIFYLPFYMYRLQLHVKAVKELHFRMLAQMLHRDHLGHLHQLSHNLKKTSSPLKIEPAMFATRYFREQETCDVISRCQMHTIPQQNTVAICANKNSKDAML